MKWNSRKKTKELSEPGMHHFVLQDGDAIVSFFSILSCHEPNLRNIPIPTLYIYEFHVGEGYQRKGLGRWQLSVIEQLMALPQFRQCRKIMLTCHTENKDAMTFYQKHGFTPDEICPSRCCSAEEAERTGYYIMSKTVSSARI